jgi:hypothetical protein
LETTGDLFGGDANPMPYFVQSSASVSGSKETEDEATLGFGVFATKDMKASEGIVLGWEEDDGNAVHLLPALLDAPDAFPYMLSSEVSVVVHLPKP